jgi:SNF family Na+-dependent transporter
MAEAEATNEVSEVKDGTALTGEDRQKWSARIAFISAAIGSAVGLGNVWRFPQLSWKYGGGAFFIPFSLSMVFIGLPLLVLEFGLGQVFRSGDVVCFNAMHPRLRGVGLGSVWGGFMIVCYYVLLIAWFMIYWSNSFRGSNDHLVWCDYADTDKPCDPSAQYFLFDKVIGYGDTTYPNGDVRRSTNVVPQTLLALLVAWFIIYLSVYKGAKVTGRITYVTMFLPMVLILFFSFFFGLHDGGEDGIREYLGKWETKQITGSESCSGATCANAWPDAVSQTFFSLSVTFGVMTAYASYNPKNQGIMVDATATMLGDFLASFLGGFAAFAAVGVYAYGTSTPIEYAVDQYSSGVSLVTIWAPSAIDELGGSPWGVSLGARKFLAFLWFSTLILLGIDSAFSMVEGFATCMKDARMFKGIPHAALLGLICVAGSIVTMLGYSSDTGLSNLDVVDYYINVSLLWVGFMECIAVGWVYGGDKVSAKIGWPAHMYFVSTIVVSSIVGPYLGIGIASYDYGELSDAGWLAGLAFGVTIFFLGFVVTFHSAWKYRTDNNLDTNPGPIIYDICLLNIEDLRSVINEQAGWGAGNVGVPILWSLLIKFVIPPVLLLMLCIKFSDEAFGAYNDYPAFYQGWGCFVGFMPWLLTAIGLVYPSAFDPFMPEEPKVQEEPVKVGDVNVEIAGESSLGEA